VNINRGDYGYQVSICNRNSGLDTRSGDIRGMIPPPVLQPETREPLRNATSISSGELELRLDLLQGLFQFARWVGLTGP